MTPGFISYLTHFTCCTNVSALCIGGHTKAATCCGWSTMYKLVFSGGEDRQLLLWSPHSCRPIGVLAGHGAGVTAVQVNEREQHIISGDRDGVIKVWKQRARTVVRIRSGLGLVHDIIPGRVLVCGMQSVKAHACMEDTSTMCFLHAMHSRPTRSLIRSGHHNTSHCPTTSTSHFVTADMGFAQPALHSNNV